MKYLSLTVAMILASASRILAHPGHGAGESNIGHYLLSPDHTLWFTLVVAVMVAFLLRKRFAVLFERHK